MTAETMKELHINKEEAMKYQFLGAKNGERTLTCQPDWPDAMKDRMQDFRSDKTNYYIEHF